MYTVDIPKVKGKMAEKNYTITGLAEKLNLDRNTLSKYLTNPGKMPYNVVAIMADLLCDTRYEAEQIFFAEKLTQYESRSQ